MRWSAPNVSAIACTMIAQLGKFYNHRLAIYGCFRLMSVVMEKSRVQDILSLLKNVYPNGFASPTVESQLQQYNHCQKTYNVLPYPDSWERWDFIPFLPWLYRDSQNLSCKLISLWRWYPVHHARWLNFKAKPWQKLITVAANGKICDTTVARTRFWSQEYK